METIYLNRDKQQAQLVINAFVDLLDANSLKAGEVLLELGQIFDEANGY